MNSEASKRMMHRLPVEAYTSQQWFDREQERIFSRLWRYAGFVEDIAAPGQYVTVQAGQNSILIIMGDDGSLRAFHNLCRHRGTQLLRSIGKSKKVIRCPYHDWTYSLDGKLVSVPEEGREFGSVDKSCLGLKPASVASWRGMLFVHPDPDAGSIDDWFGAVEPRLGPHRIEELVEYDEGRTSYEVRANWKIVVENYIDVYHLAHLHSGSLSMYDHEKAEYGFVGPHFAFREPLAKGYEEDIERNSPTPLVLPKDQLGAWVPMLFPGIGLAENESSWATFIVTPVAPDRTRVENRIRVKNVSSWAFMKQEWRSNAYWEKRVRPKDDTGDPDDPLSTGDFTVEDIYVCEQQQKSMINPEFEVGPAAEGERPVIEHQQIILDYLQEQTGAPAKAGTSKSMELTTLTSLEAEYENCLPGMTGRSGWCSHDGAFRSWFHKAR